ncbi:hypothetical protein TNCV_3884561 [Trichonephila clavipes]|nr:hypothetical protein TNCV_3884561 [Trichonephila clavipes]
MIIRHRNQPEKIRRVSVWLVCSRANLNPSTGSYCQSSCASLEGELSIKITSVDQNPPTGCNTQKRYQLPGNVYYVHNAETPIRSPLEIKKNFSELTANNSNK